MAPKTVEGGQIWLKCITGDLIMMIRDKNNIFERVENFHADLAWNYPTNDSNTQVCQTYLRVIEGVLPENNDVQKNPQTPHLQLRTLVRASLEEISSTHKIRQELNHEKF